jgi:hypothetical protein
MNYKKISIFLSCSISCLLIFASLSGAEQPAGDLSKQIFSAEVLKTFERYQWEKGVAPAADSTEASKGAASFDLKVALNERFKAFLSLGDQTVRDLAGKDIGQSYNAVFGFQIMLQ